MKKILAAGVLMAASVCGVVRAAPSSAVGQLAQWARQSGGDASPAPTPAAAAVPAKHLPWQDYSKTCLDGLVAFVNGINEKNPALRKGQVPDVVWSKVVSFGDWDPHAYKFQAASCPVAYVTPHEDFYRSGYEAIDPLGGQIGTLWTEREDGGLFVWDCNIIGERCPAP